MNFCNLVILFEQGFLFLAASKRFTCIFRFEELDLLIPAVGCDTVFFQKYALLECHLISEVLVCVAGPFFTALPGFYIQQTPPFSMNCGSKIRFRKGLGFWVQGLTTDAVAGENF